MRKHVFIVLGGLLLGSCASSRSVLYDERSHEAVVLKTACEHSQLQSPLVREADSLCSAATSLAEQDKAQQALPLLQRAVGSYQLALMQHDYQAQHTANAQLALLLQDAQEKLRTYQKIARELTAARK
jgi:hypothetical protein